MSKERLNYLRRKTADEAELWAADRIEELELVIATDTGTEGAVANLQGRIEELERQLLAEKERCDSYMEDNKRLAGERDALLADNARLREALKEVLDGETASDEDVLAIIHFARQTLAATPAQSLARLRNQVREECAAILDDDDADLYDLEFHAAAIRAMKGPE